MHRILAIGATTVLALALSGEAAAWSWPAEGAVLRPFALGADAYAAGQHRGIDVAGPDGSAVRAPAAGVVTFAGSLPTYGRGVTVTTADGYAVTLVHLGTIDVARGATVGEGDAIGTMGVSGTPEQEAPSVHLGIRRASDEEGYVDPLGLLPPRAAPAPAPSPGPEPVVASTPAPAPAVEGSATLPPPSPAPVPVPTTPPAAAAPTSPAAGVTTTPAPAPAEPSATAAPQATPAQPPAPSVDQAGSHTGVTIAGPTTASVASARSDATGAATPEAPSAAVTPLRSGAEAAHSAPAMHTTTTAPQVTAAREDRKSVV